MFERHVNPMPGSPTSYLFHVGTKSGLGHTRLCWFFDGAIGCDCAPFAQWGFYCKHLLACVSAGCITYNPILALDESWRTDESISADSVTVDGHWGKPALVVTKPWSWCAETAPELVDPVLSMLCLNDAEDDDNAAEMGQLVLGVHRTTGGERRSAGFAHVTLANSDEVLGGLYDELMMDFTAKAAELAKQSDKNKSAKLGDYISPLAMSRNVSEIATNKSKSRYG
jgi:hypothetical protein